MKAFRGVDGKIRLFRPMENMERFNRSAVAASLPVSTLVSYTRLFFLRDTHEHVICGREKGQKTYFPSLPTRKYGWFTRLYECTVNITRSFR